MTFAFTTTRWSCVIKAQAVLSVKFTKVDGSASCERSVGTVFQLSNPDAIYSRDEEKERRWLPPLVVRVCAQPMRCWAKVGDHCRSKVRDRKEGSD
jgi:hypothetical protein